MTSLSKAVQRRNRQHSPQQRYASRRRLLLEALESRQLLAADVLFTDSFEAGQWAGKWVEDSQNDWFTSTQRSTDGSRSAEVDGSANNATLTLANAIDLNGYYSPKLTFDWLIESGFDSGEYLALDISSDGGTSWQTDVLRLDGNVDAENTWHSETVDLTAYGWTNLKIRFRSTVSGSSEDANVDNVQIVGTPVSVDVDAAKPVKVFILAGQSNLTGTARVENLEPNWTGQQDDVWMWLDHNMDGGQWTTLGPGHGLSTHIPRPDEPEGFDPIGGLGPELSLGRALADAYPDHRIAFIKHGDGGRDLASHFNPENIGPPESNEHMWSGMLKKTYDAFAVLDAAEVDYEVEGFFLAIGGGDARNRNSNSSDPAEVEAGEQEALARSAAYGENLTRFINAVRDEFSDDLPFVMSRIGDDVSPELLEIYPGANLVRQAQLDVAAAMPWTAAFSGEGITLRDLVHYDAPGQIEFGTRFANNYLELVTPTGPPQIFISDNVATEGAASQATFMVSLSSATSVPVTVDFTTSDVTTTVGSDYMPTSGTLVFEPGVTSHTIVVPTIDDSDLEPTETFKVLLSHATGATIADNEGIGTIIDNEVPNAPPAVDAGADLTISDGDGTGAEAVTIMGSASDSDGTVDALEWTEGTTPLGNAATLTTTLSVGVHVLTLTATDDDGDTISDTVTVHVLANQAPSANAGADISATDTDDNGSEAISLNGSGSDADGTISYQWHVGSTILGNSASLTTTLPVGTHVLTLIVTDNGGATATDTVVVTVHPAPSEAILFEDSFEIGSGSNDWNGKWVEDSQNDFFRSTQRATDGSRSAEVDGLALGATLTLATPIDLSNYPSGTLSFDWYIESGFDSGEYLSLDISSDGGSSWTNDARRLRGNVDAENTWHSESVDLTAYASSNLKIRFRSYVSSSSEDANIDNVKIVGHSGNGGGGSLLASLLEKPQLEQPKEAVIFAVPALDPTDVNQDGHTTPLDALLIVNWLNQTEQSSTTAHLDTNRDGFVTPLDILLVINELNGLADLEGEGDGLATRLDADIVDGLFGSLEDDLRNRRRQSAQ